MPITTNPTLDLQTDQPPFVYYFDDGTALFKSVGSPEGLIAARIGSIAVSNAGLVYIKTTDSGNTGWLVWWTGTTPGAAGSNKQVQFNNSTAFGGATGFEYQSGASPNVLIQSQNSLYTGLVLKWANAGQINPLLDLHDHNGVSKFRLEKEGGFSVGGDSNFSLNNTTTSNPRKLQLQNINLGTAFRFELESEGTALANSQAGKLLLFSRYGTKIVGCTNSGSAQAFETGSSTDASVTIQNGQASNPALVVNGINGTSVAPFKVSINNADKFTVSSTGAAENIAGNSSNVVRMKGSYDTDTTSYTNSGSSLTDLGGVNVAANTLSNDGDYMEFFVGGWTAGNANNKTVSFFYGGNQFFITDPIPLNGGNWMATVRIMRRSSVLSVITTQFSTSGTGGTPQWSNNTLNTGFAATHSNANIFQVKAQATSTNDITQVITIAERGWGI